MDRKLWWQERLKLYSKWLDNMDKNPYLPQMFRDIFKNAYLPFKDPATLDMFLKQIDKFSYDHSEDLWDAFEYLLSTAWSQWDAGQFRTPRHIIDFIVSIVQPEFNDTVLDPACWTAWFLISAYKYILNQNKDKVAWDKLGLTQKKNLTEHFVGYDISPEMVKLSLVNMYLHNFGNPKIYEYDTLSDDSKWDDRFDCILANPPFMTPKGWIQPHNRFSIKASKSEVLFVDYMIEHLNPNWKAWIVVPEWIIFQSANAYKDLRKKMIKDNYLWAVISLPAWIFQPYSWVKTSILLFDQEIAKKTNNILFIKVQNDGFDLWAQRRPINKNDLPKATEILLQYKKNLLAWNEIKIENSEITLLVDKGKIEENSEFNLSMDRYKPTWPVNTSWPLIKLEDITDYEQPTNYIVDSVDYSPNYKTPVLTAWKSFILWYTNEENWIFYADKDPVIIFDDFTTWKQYVDFPFKVKSSAMKIIHAKKDLVNIKYLYYVMSNIEFNVTEWEHKRYWISEYSKKEIPLPPIEVQEKIVAELDCYQKIIDWAKAIVGNYKPTIKINPEWEMVKLGEIAKVISWQSPESSFYNESWKWLPFFQWKTEFWDKYLWEPRVWTEQITKESIKWDILMSVRAPVWPVNINVFDKICIWRWLAAIRSWEKILLDYLFTYLKGSQDKITWNSWAVFASINRSDIESIEIPLPSLEKQQQIVAEIKKEEAMVESTKQLIEVFEKKIKDKINEIRWK